MRRREACSDGIERRSLQSSLDAATDPADRKLYLDALGNAGSASSLSAIERALQDADPSVRRAALDALRKIPGAQADALIVSGLTDPAEEVRSSALGSLSARPLNAFLIEALGKALSSDESPGLRVRVVNLLGRNLTRFEGILPMLEHARDLDENADVKKAAAKAIDNGKAPAGAQKQ